MDAARFARWMISGSRRCSPALPALLILLFMAAPAFVSSAHGQQSETFAAQDTIDIPEDGSQAAQAVLEEVAWQPADFTVRVTPSTSGDYAAVVTFPSPPVGEVVDDAHEGRAAPRARLRWFAARDEAGEVIEAPAVLVIHTLHPQMIIGDAIARGFAQQDLHAFVIELPGYGLRRDPRHVPGLVALNHAAQAVAEVRRARDAIAVLPPVSDAPIALQGTSLGGFVAAVAGSIDGAFDPVVLLLAGADGYSVLRNGAADAARLRRLAHEAGHTDAQLRAMLHAMDPQHVAHRLDPQRTWLFSALDDQVVPQRNSDMLADTIDLPASHHVQFAGGHYTSLLLLPALTPRMAGIIKGQAQE